MLLLFLTLLAPFTPSLDLYISGLFYTPNEGFLNNSFYFLMFKYGEMFGLATGFVAAFLYVFSFVNQKWKKYRRGSLALILTLVIGAGLLTNVILKGHWGRPRPKQVIEFGGKHQYRPFWRPDFYTTDGPQKSFPSGHVAMGFYFLSLCLIGKRYRSLFLFGLGLFLTIFLGIGLMFVRVAQGGHFFSDVLVSPILMWYVARGVDWFLFTSEGSERQVPDANSPRISLKSDEPLEV